MGNRTKRNWSCVCLWRKSRYKVSKASGVATVTSRYKVTSGSKVRVSSWRIVPTHSGVAVPEAS